jgi:2-dehydropantoate 2-reductase
MSDRVLIMGAGAIGAYFGACLARAGREVTFVARGSNLAAMRERGVHVTGAMGDFDVSSPRDAVVFTEDASASREIDLVLLCVKNYDLEAAALAVKPCGGDVLTLQNGVDAPDVASRILGPRVLAGTTGIVADLPEPGHVHLTSSYAWIQFGEPNRSGITDRVQRAERILQVDGIDPVAVDDARVALWKKMALMCGMAGLTTLHQRPMGEILSDDELRATFERIVKECESVARAGGVRLPDDFFSDRMAYAERIDAAAMSSMSRDFARGRRIEVETFNGAIVRMGAELGIDVPANRCVYEGIAARVGASDTPGSA